MSTWATYANERGGAYALVDLWRLASAIRRCRPRLNIDKLRRVSDAFELMHARYQAELMVEAVSHHAQSVAVCEKRAQDERVGDFVVRNREFEVKTIQTLGTMERRRTGWTTAQATASRLARDLRRKAKQGFQQIASDGTVVCVVWCDFVGVVLSNELGQFRVAGPDIFEGHRYVVGARNELGRDLWFGFPTDKDWVNALNDLDVNLNARRYKSLPLGDPGVKFATNATEWMSMGRTMGSMGHGSMKTEDGQRQVLRSVGVLGQIEVVNGGLRGIPARRRRVGTVSGYGLRRPCSCVVSPLQDHGDTVRRRVAAYGVVNTSGEAGGESSHLWSDGPVVGDLLQGVLEVGGCRLPRGFTGADERADPASEQVVEGQV